MSLAKERPCERAKKTKEADIMHATYLIDEDELRPYLRGCRAKRPSLITSASLTCADEMTVWPASRKSTLVPTRMTEALGTWWAISSDHLLRAFS